MRGAGGSSPLIRFVVDQEETDPNHYRLESYLITPIQRLPRYVLLLREILKATPLDHIAYDKICKAADLMHDVTSRVNEGKREFDSKFRQTVDIANSVQGAHRFGEFIRPDRVVELDLKCTRVITRTSPKIASRGSRVIVLTDCVLVTKRKRIGNGEAVAAFVAIDRTRIRRATDMSSTTLEAYRLKRASGLHKIVIIEQSPSIVAQDQLPELPELPDGAGEGDSSRGDLPSSEGEQQEAGEGATEGEEAGSYPSAAEEDLLGQSTSEGDRSPRRTPLEEDVAVKDKGYAVMMLSTEEVQTLLTEFAAAVRRRAT